MSEYRDEISDMRCIIFDREGKKLCSHALHIGELIFAT